MILGLSVLILVSSLLRKRLFQGITMALYGLAVFNLHYWGFGIPFVLGRSVVPGAGLPTPAGAQAGPGRCANPASAQRGPGDERITAASEQALHAAHLRPPPT